MAFSLSTRPLLWTLPPSVEFGMSVRRRGYVRINPCVGSFSTRLTVMAAQDFGVGGGTEGSLRRQEETTMSQSPSPSFSSKMNKASKWLAVLVASGVLIWKHDHPTLWALVGSVVNGGICKGLKYVIDENRPSTADGIKEDPGMPSSHAQGFAYLGTYAALALLFSPGMNVWMVLAASAIILCTLYLSWLRVAEGLHTAPQVLVGNALGCAVAALWLWIWKAGLGDATAASPSLKICLLVIFLLSVIAMYVVGVRNWEPGQP